jgi:hypothetical protein
MRPATTLLASAAVLAACTFLACHSSQDEKPAAAAPAAASANAIQGTVLEVLPAAPYSYLRVKAAQGEVWAAVPAATVKVGDPVTVQVQVRMDKFQSSSLQRTFDTLYMGTLAGAAPAAPMAAAAPAAPGAAPAGPMPPAGAPMAEAAAAHGAHVLPAIEKVAKATGPNAHTVAELYAGKSTLKDRPVAVRGKVMKYMEGIMGKTWIHLCDGSGNPKTKDFDLAVTTKDKAKVGDVVTVLGILHVDRNVGSGYVYPVIVEDAKIAR